MAVSPSPAWCCADARPDEPRAPMESSSHYGCAAPLLLRDPCTRSGAAGQGWRQSGAYALWLHVVVNWAQTVTMLELHALSVRQGACVEHRGLWMRRWHEELLLWPRNRSMFVPGASTPAADGGGAGPAPGDAAVARSHHVLSSLCK